MSPEKYKLLKIRLKEVLEENQKLSSSLEVLEEKYGLLKYEKELLMTRIKQLDRKLDDTDDDLQTNSTSPEKKESNDRSWDNPYAKAPPTAHLHSTSQPPTPSNRKYPNINYNQLTPTAELPNTPEKSAGTLNKFEKFYSSSSSLPSNALMMLSNLSEMPILAPSTSPRSRIEPLKPETFQSNFKLSGSISDAHQDSQQDGPMKKKRNWESKIRKYHEIPKDPETGKLVLPCQIGIITLENLGTVDIRPAFCNARYIFPVGFQTSREYLSMISPDKSVKYTSSIQDGGIAPIFRVTSADGANVSGSSPTGVWTSVLKEVNRIRNRDHSNSISGPDNFGLSQATIIKAIQDLPNADKCQGYTWQEFELISGGKKLKTEPAAK